MPHVETFIDGVWYPSVTTVMGAEEKPWLRAWREKWGALADRKTRICGALGHEFHRCIESWLDTGAYNVGVPIEEETSRPLPSLVPRIAGMMRSWTTWATSVDGEIQWTELKVMSKTHVYSGTLDAIGTLGTSSAVIVFDWKSSSRIYPEMQIQLSAYAEAYNEQYASSSAELVKVGIIVHVSKKKPIHKLTTKEFKLGKRVFNKFLKLRANFDGVSRPSMEAAI